jgi:sterol desaturase/sphingolipid hydroxylase (fatty acid hydroxylase superfamily)
MNFIALSVPVFFLLMGLELLYGLITRQRLYRLNDAVANLGCGMGQQVLGTWFKVLTFAMYVFIYENLRIYTFPDTWYTWVLLFIGVDLCYYWFHRLSHGINAIWATHIVHHQSEEYNLSVALRQSWFQTCFSSLFYIPLSFLGFNPVTMLTVAAFQTLYQFWIHTKAIKKLPAPVEYIFNTPSHHRVHHGTNPKYIDRNHAGTLIIWDRMFGTFQEEEEEVYYGITTPLNSWNPVRANFHYWADIVRLSRKSRSLKDRINAFIRPPGWMPAELGGFQHPKEIDKEAYRKFDVEVPKWLSGYAFVQFVFVIVITSYFMFSADHMFEAGNSALLVKYSAMGAYILLAIHNLGAIFENRASAFVLETVRHALTIGLLWFFRDDAQWMPIAAGTVGFTLISILFFVYKTVSRSRAIKTEPS